MLLGIKMSTHGAVKESIPSYSTLNDLINSKNEKAAVALIKKGGIAFDQFDKKGYLPIHWAAAKGCIKVFKALCKKGADPYALDQNGFCALYHAQIHKQKDFLSFYDKEYPSVFDQIAPDAIVDEINELLQRMGFVAYTIGSKEPTTDDNYLISLFSPVTTPAKSSKSGKLDLKKEMASQINPIQLTRIAFGITEVMSPTDIVNTLKKYYDKMDYRAKLASIYFIKEIIRQDTSNELIDAFDFAKAFSRFVNNIGNSFAMTSLKGKLQKYHQTKLTRTAIYLQDKQSFAFDLANMFREAVLDISPKDFQAVNLLKNKDNNRPFLALSALTNQLSHLVCLDILHAPSGQEGLERMMYFMDMIAICLKEPKANASPILPYNLAAAAAIYNGLKFNVITRLSHIKDLPDAYGRAMERYDELFHVSSRGLRSAMLETPACIPVIAVYSADKDKISENKLLADRVILFGKLNEQYAAHCAYLQSLEQLASMPSHSDIHKHVQKVEFSDESAYWYSYHLEPARVIELSEQATLGDVAKILSDLKHCRDVRSCLAVTLNNQNYRGTSAKNRIISYLGKLSLPTDTVKEITTLCDKVIEQFYNDAPVAAKGKFTAEHAPKKLKRAAASHEAEDITHAFADMKLEDPNSDALAHRPRSKTRAEIAHHDRRKSERPRKGSGSEYSHDSDSMEATPSFTPSLSLTKRSGPQSAATSSDVVKASSSSPSATSSKVTNSSISSANPFK